MKALLLFLALIPAQCAALTLSELRDDTRYLITDGPGTRQRFTNSQLTGFLNEGQRIVDMRTTCNYKAVSFDLAVNTTYYSLPSDFLMTRRVTRDNMELYEMTPAALDSRSSQWETSTGVPTYYFINFSSRTKMGFAPYPATVADTDTVKVEYMAYSAALSADGDIPFGSTSEFYAYHTALSYYAAYKAALIDDRVNLATIFLQQFEAFVTIMKEKCVDRPNYIPGLIGRKQ